MSTAFTKNILPVGGSEKEGIHTSNTSWILTFVRWENRSPIDQPGKDLDTREPMVVVNDCISVSVASSKDSHTPTMNANLKLGDINYMTSLSPGDFVFVNIVNSESKANSIASRASSGKSINGIDDGFKGFFKIQSVRKILSVDPHSGTRSEMCNIQGFAFTEFNNSIYFNPFLIDESQKNDLLFITKISDQWNQYVSNKSIVEIQGILKLIINSFVGSGPSDNGKKLKNEIVVSPNTQFFVPQKTGSLLGVVKAVAAKDLYNYYIGIQTYSSGVGSNVQRGMNPTFTTTDGRFYETPTKITGLKYLQAEFWNQVTVWSILQQYLNSPINEIYTCFKISPEGKVMPTLVVRQTPFSSEVATGSVTKFLSLPRWKISTNLIYSLNIGREEAARVNFVQIFGKIWDSNGNEISQDIAKKNYKFDIKDIQRSGLRPYIAQCNFNDLTDKKGSGGDLVIGWVKLMSDIVIGQHLKLNGTIECAGIYDAICVGDNLELDGVVYHIESVSHSANINPMGVRSFRTTLELSHGVASNQKSSKYAQMENPDGQAYRKSNQTGIMPGYTDIQQIGGATRNSGGEETKLGSNKRFKG